MNVGYMIASGDQTEFLNYNGNPRWETKAKVNGGAGLAFAYEYRHTDLIGFEAGVGYFQTKLRLQVWDAYNKQAGYLFWDAEKTTHTLPISVGLNFHLVQKGPVDFFIGPRLSYMTYGSYSVAERGSEKEVAKDVKADLKKEIVLGLTMGLDLPMAANWNWSFRLDYAPAQVKIDTFNRSFSTGTPGKSETVGDDVYPFVGNKLKPNPITLTVGASYKF